MLVHCLDGCRRSGLFLVCFNLLLFMDSEELCHLGHCVLGARETIADCVVDEEQLKFCIEIAKLHLEANQIYVSW